MKANWLQYMEDKEKLKKKADHSRLVGGRFNMQRNLHMSRSLHSVVPHPPPHPAETQSAARILKLYIEDLMEFSHVISPNGLSTTLLSQGCIHEMTASVGIVGRIYIPRTGEGEQASSCMGPALRSTRGHVLSVTSCNTHMKMVLYLAF